MQPLFALGSSLPGQRSKPIQQLKRLRLPELLDWRALQTSRSRRISPLIRRSRLVHLVITDYMKPLFR
jgi:hypothetical protein